MSSAPAEAPGAAPAAPKKTDWVARQINRLAGFFGKAALGVLGGGVETIRGGLQGTAGNISGEAKEIGHRIGYTAKASGAFSTVGKVGKDLAGRAGKITGCTAEQ